MDKGEFKKIWHGFLEGKCRFMGCEELRRQFQIDLNNVGCCGSVRVTEQWKQKLKEHLGVE